MADAIQGSQFRIVFSSADATTAAAISLYDCNGTLRPLLTGERLIIDSIVVAHVTAATTITLFDDADNDGIVDAGEQIAVVVHSATNTSQILTPVATTEGMSCGLNRLPKIKASGAGQVDVTGIGHLVNG